MVIKFIAARFCLTQLIWIVCWVILSPLEARSQSSSSDYHWYHEGTQVKLQIIPNQIVSFDDHSSNNEDMIRSLKPQKIKKLTGGAQLMELSAKSFSNYLADGSQFLKKGSPLFKEGGFIKALPGGIIVNFKKGVTEAEVQQLCDRLGLKIKKQYSQGWDSPMWLLESPPGLESLRLANTLVENHGIIILKARPNFWQPINTKELKSSDQIRSN